MTMWLGKKYVICESKNNRAIRGFRNYLTQKPVLRMNKLKPSEVERVTLNSVF